MQYYGTDDLEIDSWKGHLRIRGVPNERLSRARNEMYAQLCPSIDLGPRRRPWPELDPRATARHQLTVGTRSTGFAARAATSTSAPTT